MKREAQLPIALTEADGVFEPLVKFDHLVLAVSGGPDSMALLVLAADWHARRDRTTTPSISVATVDHGLRENSRAEAELVGREARRLGLPHAILIWAGEKPVTGISSAARGARYRLLDEHARTFSTKNVAVVTAHHLDDQAETFAMRLARGAGVPGLAAMRSERPLLEGSPVRLVRPFLPFPKCRLIATLQARDLPFVDDPTNSDERYERARVRQFLPALEAVGISADAIALSARRLGNAESALRYAEDQFIATLDLSFGNEVFASFDRGAFCKGPNVLRQRVLARLISRYCGASQRPELSEVEDLAERLDAAEKSTATLGGVMISSGSRVVRLWREAGRLDFSEIELAPGESRTWDQRFIVRRSAEAEGPVKVRPLGAEHYTKLCPRLSPGRRPPARAAHALPSFWIGSDLVAVPSLAPFAIVSEPPFAASGCDLKILALSAGY
jgi:tRNA(Ile)-lysidine synthase